MFCESCDAKLDKKWSFCPFCGEEIAKNTSLFEFLDRQMKNLTKRMKIENITFDDLELPNNITISINSKTPKQFPAPQRVGTNQYTAETPRKLPVNVAEPETTISRLNNLLTVTVKLPEVRSLNDIDIHDYSNSIEIRAFSKDKGYFKIVNVPENFSLANKLFENGKLILTFSA
jgi:HSP20 family molecular chaperone IbpA